MARWEEALDELKVSRMKEQADSVTIRMCQLEILYSKERKGMMKLNIGGWCA